MNLLNYGIIMAIVISCITSAFELYHYENTETEKRLLNLNLAIVCYGFAAIWEAVFEKYNVKQIFMKIRNVLKYNYIRTAIIEMCSFLPKTLFIFIAAQLGLFQKWGILVFGIGQFIYAFLLCMISFLANEKQHRNFLNVPITDDQQPNQTYFVDKTTK